MVDFDFVLICFLFNSKNQYSLDRKIDISFNHLIGSWNHHRENSWCGNYCFKRLLIYYFISKLRKYKVLWMQIHKAPYTIGAQVLYNTCNRSFMVSLVLLHTLQELSHSLIALLWLHRLPKNVDMQTIQTQPKSKLLKCNARTLMRMFYSIGALARAMHDF